MNNPWLVYFSINFLLWAFPWRKECEYTFNDKWAEYWLASSLIVVFAGLPIMITSSISKATVDYLSNRSKRWTTKRN